METFGTRLRKKRNERELSQEVVASRIGVKRSAVSQWENDETQPKGKNLLALSRLLNVDIYELQTGKKKGKEDLLDGLSNDAIEAIHRIIELDKEKDSRVKAVRTLLG